MFFRHFLEIEHENNHLVRTSGLLLLKLDAGDHSNSNAKKLGSVKSSKIEVELTAGLKLVSQKNERFPKMAFKKRQMTRFAKKTLCAEHTSPSCVLPLGKINLHNCSHIYMYIYIYSKHMSIYVCLYINVYIYIFIVN